jgi:protein-arginine kinase activator protein McsA
MLESVRQRYEVGRTLDEQLAEAIRAENYELAASIRDQMIHDKSPDQIRSPGE